MLCWQGVRGWEGGGGGVRSYLFRGLEMAETCSCTLPRNTSLVSHALGDVLVRAVARRDDNPSYAYVARLAVAGANELERLESSPGRSRVGLCVG